MARTIGLPNAPWWLPHSTVAIREDYLAEDEASVVNRLVRLDAGNVEEVKQKHRDILRIQCVVQPGSVVAVQRQDYVKTVHLPDEAGQLLNFDLEYIAGQLDKLYAPPMTKQEQGNSLPSASDSLPVS